MSRTYRDRDFRRLRQLEQEMSRFRSSVLSGRSYHASRRYARLLREYEHLASRYGMKKRHWNRQHRAGTRHGLQTVTHKLRKARRAARKHAMQGQIAETSVV